MKAPKTATLLTIAVAAIAFLALGPGCKQNVAGMGVAGTFSDTFVGYPNPNVTYSTGYVTMNQSLTTAFNDDSLPNDSFPNDTTFACDTNALPVRRFSKHNGSEEWRAAHDFLSASSWLTKRGWAKFDFVSFTPSPGTRLVAETLFYHQYYMWCRPVNPGYPHCEIDLLSIDPVSGSAQTIFNGFGTPLAWDIPSSLGWVKVALPPLNVNPGAAFSIALGWKVYPQDDPGPRGTNEFAYAHGAGSGNSKPRLKLVYE